MDVPCGHCIPCRVAHSREWATRIVHEAQYWPHNSFTTLTYDEDQVPKDGGLVPDDLTKFFKRMRKAGFNLKYFACGEYGEKYGRPHYHSLLFGVGIMDYQKVQDTWGHGSVDMGTLSYDSARYCADYILKRYNGPLGKKIYGHHLAPFQRSSAGIGLRYCMDHAEEIKRDLSIKLRGHEVGIPRYYKLKLGIDADDLLSKRLANDRETFAYYTETLGRTYDDLRYYKLDLKDALDQNERNIVASTMIKRAKKNSYL
ncbi:hypothetical protein AGMMS4956_20860 [Bacteroidia bacterium]|nr:hypothetical protein AGMMS4956_20860 [Bacteroidia bacterium]GHV02568.1 hypothetical protein AGMMS49521_4460 [Campylobacterota bacterium]